MKKTLPLIFLLAICCSRSFAQPSIRVVEGATFSFGSIIRGEVVERTLTIENSGKDTLNIVRVDVSCGCTGSMLSNDRIPPQERGTLRITFNSKNFRGAFHKSLTVNSNAADNPHLVVEFDGTIEEDVTVAPEYIWFEDAALGVRSAKSITVANTGKTPLTLIGYAVQTDGVHLVLPTSPIKPGGSIDISLEFTPVKATSVVSDRLVIRTDNPRQPEVSLGFYGNIKSPEKK